MNKFLKATISAINRNGVEMTYTSNARVVDEIEGTVINTTTDHTLKIYPKHTQASQYNMPLLIGKEVIVFYIANDSLPFTVKVSDSITYNGDTYRINSYQEHLAAGLICLYKAVGVKG